MALELEKKGLAPVGGEIRMSAPEERVVIETPEQAEEQVAEMQGEAEAPAPEPVVVVAPLPRVVQPATTAKDPVTKQIEAVLSEDLSSLYKQLPPERQAIFRTKGEQVAEKIRGLLSSAKVQAEKILALIKDWLKMLKGVNPFFLEQEAKIKTDKLLLMKSSDT